MRRRDFIRGIGGSAAAWPLGARAQQPARKVQRVGVLMAGTEADPQLQAGQAKFTKALAELGWTDARNIRIDYRWANADLDRMSAFAKELVEQKPDVIVGHTTPVTAALQRETKTIPIVFVVVSDPVGSGFVASLARPGGNTTGFINLEGSLAGKWIELLKDIIPNLRRAVIIFNPETAPYFSYYLQPFEAAARSAGIEPVTVRIHALADIEPAFAGIAGQSDVGLIQMPDIFSTRKDVIDLITSVAARNRVPAIYPYGYMVAAGGLISYGVDAPDLFRRAADYVDRILKGAKPSDLPVQLPTRFELAVNLKTARALGLTIPGTLIARADEVIE